jgi:hypothetical protein
MNKKVNSYKIYMLASLIATPALLAGCDSFRNTFGLDHSSPNEWNTAEPSPGLILPPDFASRPKLPPPNPGAPNPHVVPDTVRAQKTVLGNAQPPHVTASSTKSEKDIIEKASENQEVTPDIRKKVDEEAQADSTVSGKVISKIQSWKKEAAENLSNTNQKAKNPQDGETSTDQQEED